MGGRKHGGESGAGKSLLKTFSVPSYNTIGDPYLKDPKLRRPRGLGKGISGRYVGYSDNVLGTIGNTIHDTAPPNRSKADSYPLARGKQLATGGASSIVNVSGLISAPDGGRPQPTEKREPFVTSNRESYELARNKQLGTSFPKSGMRGSLGTDALFDTKWMALSEKDGGYQDKADNGAVITSLQCRRVKETLEKEYRARQRRRGSGQQLPALERVRKMRSDGEGPNVRALRERYRRRDKASHDPQAFIRSLARLAPAGPTLVWRGRATSML